MGLGLVTLLEEGSHWVLFSPSDALWYLFTSQDVRSQLALPAVQASDATMDSISLQL